MTAMLPGARTTMPMTARKRVIVNADDFGQSHGVNRGIIEAREHGIVTSASLMVRWPAAPEAAAYGRAHPAFSLGLHLDLGEWIYRGDSWVPLYEVVRLDDAVAVADEVSRQLTLFTSLVGRPPTHVDSHQHIHLHEPARSIVIDVARELGAPVRHLDPAVNFCGDFYGQDADGSPLPEAISVDGLLELLIRLPPGVTELSCHPGVGDDLDTMYRVERAEEIRTLCDPRLRAAIGRMQIQLGSFADLMARKVGHWITLNGTSQRTESKVAP